MIYSKTNDLGGNFMTEIQICRPKMEEEDSINDFFKIVLQDTFDKNNILYLTETLDNEIRDKRRILRQDFESNGEARFFLIVKDVDKVVGSIEYGPSNELIKSCTNGELKEVIEIGTVFVHPEYQKQGLGNYLLQEIYRELQKKGIEEFCLDSGYKTAQIIWLKKFGSPTYHLRDYWEKGADHMIWKVSLANLT